MRGTRSITATSLILLLVLLVGVTWAYWERTRINTADFETGSNTITIGTSTERIVTASLSSTYSGAQAGKVLVPAGQTAYTVNGATTAVETVTVTFNVKWTPTEASLVADGTLSYELADIMVGTLTNAQAKNIVLVNRALTGTQAIQANDDDGVTLTFVFTLDQPEDRVHYEQIAGKDITFKLKLSVASTSI